MHYFAISLLIFMLYLVLHSLVDRVCRCIEHCATAKSIAKVYGVDIKDMDKDIFNKMNAAIREEVN